LKVTPRALSFDSIDGVLAKVKASGILPAAENPLPGLKLPCEVRNGILNTYYPNLA
jgi:hypothetical protein